MKILETEIGNICRPLYCCDTTLSTPCLCNDIGATREHRQYTPREPCILHNQTLQQNLDVTWMRRTLSSISSDPSQQPLRTASSSDGRKPFVSPHRERTRRHVARERVIGLVPVEVLLRRERDIVDRARTELALLPIRLSGHDYASNVSVHELAVQRRRHFAYLCLGRIRRLRRMPP